MNFGLIFQSSINSVYKNNKSLRSNGLVTVKKYITVEIQAIYNKLKTINHSLCIMEDQGVDDMMTQSSMMVFMLLLLTPTPILQPDLNMDSSPRLLDPIIIPSLSLFIISTPSSVFPAPPTTSLTSTKVLQFSLIKKLQGVLLQCRI